MLKQGIYEHIINQETDRKMQEAEQSGLVCVQQPIDGAESPQMLANYLANAIRQKLEDTEEQQDRVNLINRIMVDAGLLDDKQIVKPADLLAEVMTQQQSALQNQSNTQTIRPISGFRVSNLFTGGSSTLSLGEEIRREIASADEICFIVSFLKVSGVRILLDDLKKFCGREGTRLRIITTTYCGATQAKAIEQLAALPNTEIRISYNTDIERLHAKSYIFVRNSGMNTAYIGSSNLSKSAQTEGLEWNMRVTSVENPHIIKTALATFEMYWNSPNFEDFRIGGIEKFNKEIHRNIFHTEAADFVYQRYTILPHQKQILDKLRVEREDIEATSKILLWLQPVRVKLLYRHLTIRSSRVHIQEPAFFSQHIVKRFCVSRSTHIVVFCKMQISARYGLEQIVRKRLASTSIYSSLSRCSTLALMSSSHCSIQTFMTI